MSDPRPRLLPTGLISVSPRSMLTLSSITTLPFKSICKAMIAREAEQMGLRGRQSVEHGGRHVAASALQALSYQCARLLCMSGWRGGARGGAGAALQRGTG